MNKIVIDEMLLASQNIVKSHDMLLGIANKIESGLLATQIADAGDYLITALENLNKVAENI